MTEKQAVVSEVAQKFAGLETPKTGRRVKVAPAKIQLGEEDGCDHEFCPIWCMMGDPVLQTASDKPERT